MATLAQPIPVAAPVHTLTVIELLLVMLLIIVVTIRVQPLLFLLAGLLVPHRGLQLRHHPLHHLATSPILHHCLRVNLLLSARLLALLLQ